MNEEKNRHDKAKSFGRSLWKGLKKLPTAVNICLLIAVLAVVVYCGYRVNRFVVGRPPETAMEVKSSLQSLENASSLRVMNTPYSAVATVYQDKEQKKPLYHVWYNGIIKMNTDFSEIQVEGNEESRELVVTMRPVQLEYELLDGFEYLPEAPNNEKGFVEARKAAEADLKKRVLKDVNLNETANENARTILKEFTESITGGEYQVTVVTEAPATASSAETKTGDKSGTEKPEQEAPSDEKK